MPITTLLGIGIEPLVAHTIAEAYPWITSLVARSALAPGHLRGPKLRYVARPHCLGEQRLERGSSWLRVSSASAWLGRAGQSLRMISPGPSRGQTGTIRTASLRGPRIRLAGQSLACGAAPPTGSVDFVALSLGARHLLRQWALTASPVVP